MSYLINSISLPKLMTKCLITGVLYYGSFIYGLVSKGLFGATIYDLAKSLGVEMEEMTIMYSCITAGYTLAAFSGIIYDYVNRELALSLSLAMIAVTIFFIPHCGHLWLIYLLSVVQGSAQAAWECGSTVWLISLWEKNPLPALQGTFMMFGIGTIAGPMLVWIFHAPGGGQDNHHQQNSTNDSIDDTYNQTVSNATSYHHQELIQLQLQYGLVAVLSLLAAAAVIMLVFVETPEIKFEEEEEKREEDLVRPKTTSFDVKVIIILSIVFLSSYNSIEFIVYDFTPSFARLYYDMSAEDAATAVSIVGVSTTVLRPIFIFLSFKMAPKHLMIVYYMLAIIANITILAMSGLVGAFYTSCGVFGAAFSGTYGTTFAFFDRIIRTSNLRTGLIIAGGGLMPTLWPILIGKTIEHWPFVVFVVTMVNIGISIVTFGVILAYVQWKCPKRGKKDEDDDDGATGDGEEKNEKDKDKDKEKEKDKDKEETK